MEIRKRNEKIPLPLWKRDLHLRRKPGGGLCLNQTAHDGAVGLLYRIGCAANAVCQVRQCAFQHEFFLFREFGRLAVAVNAIQLVIEPGTRFLEIAVSEIAP